MRGARGEELHYGGQAFFSRLARPPIFDWLLESNSRAQESLPSIG